MSKYIDADELIKKLKTDTNMMLDDVCTVKDTIDDMPAAGVETVKGWVSVKDRLPERSSEWEKYLVIVNRSHFPTSTYDLCDAPYDEELIATAMYDSEQKIWHLEWDEALNALIDIDSSPLNGDCITHWMPLDVIPRP